MVDKKIVFLDRDGVINQYPGDGSYVLSKEELKVFEFAKPSIKKLKENGFLVYIVSNQACVSKGLLTRTQLIEITDFLLQQIEDSVSKIDEVYYCLHTEEDNCFFRKPKPGMLIEVFKKLEVQPQSLTFKPFFIGDSLLDIKTAQALNLRSILVLSGKEKKACFQEEVKPDYVFENLSKAVDFILQAERINSNI